MPIYFECIVVDDGSKDETPSVLRGYSGRIRVIRQENAGRSAARNRGIQEARGELVAFLDSDDSWEPAKLARQIAWHEQHPEAVLSAHGILVVHPDGRVEEQAPRCDREALSKNPYEAVLDGFAFFPSVVMAKTALARELGGFGLGFHGAEDLDFALKLALRGAVTVFDDCLTRMHQHDGQTARKQLAEMNAGVMEAHLRDYAQDFGPDRKARLQKKLARYELSIAKRCKGVDRKRWLDAALSHDASLRFKPGFWKLRLGFLGRGEESEASSRLELIGLAALGRFSSRAARLRRG
jgi:glycosyltransferase involved in cell wall biosynthesis